MKKVIWVTLSKLLISIISVFLLRIYSNNLTYSEIGLVALLMNFESFFGLVYASPLGNYISLTCLQDMRDKILGQKFLDYIYITFFASIFSFIFFLFYEKFYHLHLTSAISIAFIVYLFLNNTTPFISSLLLLMNRTKASVFLQLVKSVSGLFAFIVIFLYIKSLNGWVIGSLVGLVIPTIINLIYIKEFTLRKIRFPKGEYFLKKDLLVKFILPFSVMQLLLWLFFNSYRNLASKFFDLTFLGELALVFTFASQFCSAYDALISQIYQADFYKFIDNNHLEKKIKKYGLFLNKIQSVYLLFFIMGSIPFAVAFELLVKPKTEIDLSILLAAWCVNFVRINFNLFGLITQVTMNPKTVTRYILSGIILIGLVFGGMSVFNLEISKYTFLSVISIVSFVSLLAFILNISRKIESRVIFRNYLITLIVFFGLLLLLSVKHLETGIIKHNLTTLVVISTISLGILGLLVLYLPKKLQSI